MTFLTDRFTGTVVQDLKNPAVRMAVFERFKGGVGGTLEYYEALLCTLQTRGCPVAKALDVEVERMHALAGERQRLPLGAEGAVP